MKKDKRLAAQSPFSRQGPEISISRGKYNKTKIPRPLWYIFLLFNVLYGCSKKEDPVVVLPVPVNAHTPSVILKDHHYFLQELEPVTILKDSTGYFARELYEVMKYHFKEEEDYVLPPLGILPVLARGEFPANAEEIIGLTEKFRKNSAVMNAEHQMITHLLGQMVLSAGREGHVEFKVFEEELHKHADLEEEVLFPMVLVIGDYLKLQSEKRKE